jgi:hypothetical protein
MRKVNLKSDQNIIDIAIQETGSIEGLIDIIKDNSAVVNVNHVFKFGDKILVQEVAKDVNIKDYFAKRPNLFVSTTEEEINGDFNEDFNDDFGGGSPTPIVVGLVQTHCQLLHEVD